MPKQSNESETIISLTPELPFVRVLDQEGNIKGGLVEFSSAEHAKTLVEFMARIYTNKEGSDAFNVEEIALRNNFRVDWARQAMRNFAKIAPAEVKFNPEYDRVNLGRFAIATLVMTEEEKQKFSDRKYVSQLAKEGYKKATLEAESQKESLLDKDHALAKIGDKKFSIPLDSIEGIIATRLLQALSECRRGMVKRSYIVDRIWGAMTIEERQLFSDEEDMIFSDGKKIKKSVHKVFSPLMLNLGAAKTQNDQSYKVITNNIRVQTFDLPHWNNDTPQVIFYEGSMPKSGIDESLISQANEVISLIENSDVLSPEKAIDVLDLIIDREGKEALRSTVLGLDINDYKNFIEKAYQKVSNALGEDYYQSARLHRIIGLSSKNSRQKRRINLQGGMRHLERVKHYIGTKDDPDGEVKAN